MERMRIDQHGREDAGGINDERYLGFAGQRQDSLVSGRRRTLGPAASGL